MISKNFRSTFNYITLMLICQVMLTIMGAVTGVNQAKALDVNNFYFSDFTGDYYLSKDDEGVSKLKIKESVTAEFPNYNQNKGICRQISYTNQNGANLTLKGLTKNSITLTRNGDPEPIYSIEQGDGYYDVCTGTEEYLQGTQVYVFEYEFENVVTDFGDYQELYWDTNGNGSAQRFDKVTARIHFANISDFTGSGWCYVGKYGEKGQDRCTASELIDGVELTSEQLAPGENMTFDVEIKPGSFVVLEPEKNNTYVWITIGTGVLCLLTFGFAIRAFIKSRAKAAAYEGIFVKPEYQPHDKYALSELAEIYLGKKKDAKVGMLLELIVKKKIELKKQDKRKWSFTVKDLKGLGEEYIDLLSILNKGTRVAEGDEVTIERHTATKRLIELKNSMETKILGNLKEDKLVEKKYKIGDSSKHGLANTIATTIVLAPIVWIIWAFIAQSIAESVGANSVYTGRLVFGDYYLVTCSAMIIVTTIACVAFGDASVRYKGYTLEGLRASRYMDGLKLYIQMAEAERMKLLQSVDGADTSPEGIVKLYEKLLPYAAVFGLEESWMNEMKEYCEVEEVEIPDYLMEGMIASNMMRTVRNASIYVDTATRMTSSGGSFSSGFSGGGGGGFSGGGGGGGGFGGR